MGVVVVGMSGGVDSSVSAALLQKAGHTVYGAFIRVWEPVLPSGSPTGVPGACNWREEYRDALRVAAHLGIPLELLDAQEAYKNEVVDGMISEYRRGRTPNPDVLCNRSVKFDVLKEYALRIGADFIATGHYARTENGKLFTAVDTEKDQSYFLWGVSRALLLHALFPVGEMTKKEVRQYAVQVGLPNAQKKDSQGLCFIGPVDMKDFLRAFIPVERGDVLDTKGNVVGQHPGALLFTIGERHGFTVNDPVLRSTPLFITAKNIEKNTLTVSAVPPVSESDSLKIFLEQSNWIGSQPEGGREYGARLRYRAPLIPAYVSGELVALRTPALVSPGQSLVLYDGQECLGGGIIS